MNIKHFLIYIFLITATGIYAHFYKAETAYIFTMPWPTQHEVEQNGRQLFEAASLELPHLLEQACTEKKQVILALPDCYEKTKTTEYNAPIIEGARIALAWASVYHRFFNVDTRIVLMNEATPDCRPLIQSLLHQTFSPGNTPEESIQNRIVTCDTLSQSDNYQLTPFSCVEKLQKNPFIKPYLLPNKKRVLILGGAGFIGSHLTKKFLDNNYFVINVDNFACCTGEHIEAFEANPNFEFCTFDVSQPFDVEGPIDIIIHLASLPSPKDYYERPIETLHSGLNGTKNCLELARKKNARFLLGSTSEVYGDPEIHPQPESYAGQVDPIGKRSQYDQSKRGAETFSKIYFETYHIDIRIARIFNTYGPHMRLGDGRVITNFIKAALENKPITIYGDGTQTRSFGFVSDTVEGLYRLATHDSINEFRSIDERIFNVGNPEEFSINQVAETVNRLSLHYLKKPVSITHIPQFDLTDPKLRKPDITRISQVTHYAPQVSFEEGIEKTFCYFMHKKSPA